METVESQRWRSIWRGESPPNHCLLPFLNIPETVVITKCGFAFTLENSCKQCNMDDRSDIQIYRNGGDGGDLWGRWGWGNGEARGGDEIARRGLRWR